MTDTQPATALDAGVGDWLHAAWLELPDRVDSILTRRLAGEGLADVGRTYDLTRERVRQLQLKGERALLTAQQRHDPDLPERVATALGDAITVCDDRVAELVPSQSVTGRQALLRVLGVARPRTWAGDLHGWWSRHPAELGIRLRDLAAEAPFTVAEVDAAATALGLPEDLPLAELLGGPDSPLICHRLGWIRRGRASADKAFLWLRGEDSTRSVGDIAAAAEVTENAVRDGMRRDDRFSQVRPEGTWALTDWRLPGAGSRYSSAVEVVVEVLQDQGPLTLQQLQSESQRRYPVSTWRITQCLSSNLIGLNKEGQYDLAERGATPIEDSEPRRPNSIQLSPDGSLIGVALTVDSDVLRGSGIAVNRWLTWYLGLRTAPSDRHFPYTDIDDALVVRRTTSTFSLSRLRAPVLRLDLVEGCRIAVLIRLSPESATIRHICDSATCPAR